MESRGPVSAADALGDAAYRRISAGTRSHGIDDAVLSARPAAATATRRALPGSIARILRSPYPAGARRRYSSGLASAARQRQTPHAARCACLPHEASDHHLRRIIFGAAPHQGAQQRSHCAVSIFAPRGPAVEITGAATSTRHDPSGTRLGSDSTCALNLMPVAALRHRQLRYPSRSTGTHERRASHIQLRGQRLS